VRRCAHISTRFAWIGDIDENAVFYYCIHSPVILIGFDHQGSNALAGPRDVPRAATFTRSCGR
jgi:hypothetical protein